MSFMLKNVTLRAKERLIAQARQRAQRERKTLNTAFWGVAGSEFKPGSDKFQAGHCQG
jgi:hypothetical protein